MSSQEGRVAKLGINLLGSFQVFRGDQVLTKFKSNKVRAVLAYLVAEADSSHHRSSLAGLLWPEYPEKTARRNLRDILSNLRQAIGDREAQPPYLLITRQSLQFNPASACSSTPPAPARWICRFWMPPYRRGTAKGSKQR